ncbi:MAG: hypothetical protein ACOX6S_05245 [Clostridia bacterium]|jgi:hypothetical protein
MSFRKFNRDLLKLKPLKEREHDLHMDIMLNLEDEIPEFEHPTLDILADRIWEASKKQASVIFMMGGHVIRSGVSPFLIELMKRGLVSHFAMNGAGAIHDFELALIGATTESVAKYISEGQFGLWQETGRINEAAIEGARDGLGLGEAIGRMIETEDFPYKENSILAAGYRYRVPVTVHVGIGCDIIHEHPNCDGAALGESSYTDFLIYANSIYHLENGVFLNFGSAVVGPEVYLKCLAMARNVAHQQGKVITHFTTAVFDLLPLEEENFHETPPKDDPRYYFRPWKTILTRTVADGGEAFYIQGSHRQTIPNLAKKLFLRSNS